MRTRHFFCYDAGTLAIDPARPFQVVSRPFPAIVGQLATMEAAESAVSALQSARDARTLPCNVREWEHFARYLGRESE